MSHRIGYQAIVNADIPGLQNQRATRNEDTSAVFKNLPQ